MTLPPGRLSQIKFNVQHSTMSSVLPFDIIAQIIDTVGKNEDTNLLKELALVSHSFLQICTKHLFSTVDLFRSVTSHLQRRDLSSYLKAGQILSSISANSRIKWDMPVIIAYSSHLAIQFSTTKIICSHPSFQISSEQFLVSAASQSPLQTCRTWTGIHWTLP